VYLGPHFLWLLGCHVTGPPLVLGSQERARALGDDARQFESRVVHVVACPSNSPRPFLHTQLRAPCNEGAHPSS